MPGIAKSIIGLLKRIPSDLGQGAVAETTKGKQIALSLVPDGHRHRALDMGARYGKQTRWLESRTVHHSRPQKYCNQPWARNSGNRQKTT